jgi:hypothetical protein
MILSYLFLFTTHPTSLDFLSILELLTVLKHCTFSEIPINQIKNELKKIETPIYSYCIQSSSKLLIPHCLIYLLLEELTDE